MRLRPIPISCCVSTRVASLRVFQIWKFFGLFYRKVHKKSVVFALQAGDRVWSYIPSFMPASKSSFAVCFSQAGRR